MRLTWKRPMGIIMAMFNFFWPWSLKIQWAMFRYIRTLIYINVSTSHNPLAVGKLQWAGNRDKIVIHFLVTYNNASYSKSFLKIFFPTWGKAAMRLGNIAMCFIICRVVRACATTFTLAWGHLRLISSSCDWWTEISLKHVGIVNDYHLH